MFEIIIINGYLEDDKYFVDYRNDIVNMFSPDIDNLNYINNKKDKNIFVAGGGEVYNSFMTKYIPDIIYATEVFRNENSKNIEPDVFFPYISSKYKISDFSLKEKFEDILDLTTEAIMYIWKEYVDNNTKDEKLTSTEAEIIRRNLEFYCTKRFIFNKRRSI